MFQPLATGRCADSRTRHLCPSRCQRAHFPQRMSRRSRKRSHKTFREHRKVSRILQMLSLKERKAGHIAASTTELAVNNTCT